MKKLILFSLLSFNLFSQQLFSTKEKEVCLMEFEQKKDCKFYKDSTTFQFSKDFKQFISSEATWDISIPERQSNGSFQFHSIDFNFYFELNIMNGTLDMLFDIGAQTYYLTYFLL